MKHLYIAGEVDGQKWIEPETDFEYCVKAVDWDEEAFLLESGWSESLEEAKKKGAPKGDEAEQMQRLRATLKSLGGTYGPRTSRETLIQNIAALEVDKAPSSEGRQAESQKVENGDNNQG